jgi:hypothetical protein
MFPDYVNKYRVLTDGLSAGRFIAQKRSFGAVKWLWMVRGHSCQLTHEQAAANAEAFLIERY